MPTITQYPLILIIIEVSVSYAGRREMDVQNETVVVDLRIIREWNQERQIQAQSNDISNIAMCLMKKGIYE